MAKKKKKNYSLVIARGRRFHVYGKGKNRRSVDVGRQQSKGKGKAGQGVDRSVYSPTRILTGSEIRTQASKQARSEYAGQLGEVDRRRKFEAGETEAAVGRLSGLQARMEEGARGEQSQIAAAAAKRRQLAEQAYASRDVSTNQQEAEAIQRRKDQLQQVGHAATERDFADIRAEYQTRRNAAEKAGASEKQYATSLEAAQNVYGSGKLPAATKYGESLKEKARATGTTYERQLRKKREDLLRERGQKRAEYAAKTRQSEQEAYLAAQITKSKISQQRSDTKLAELKADLEQAKFDLDETDSATERTLKRARIKDLNQGIANVKAGLTKSGGQRGGKGGKGGKRSEGDKKRSQQVKASEQWFLSHAKSEREANKLYGRATGRQGQVDPLYASLKGVPADLLLKSLHRAKRKMKSRRR